MAAQPQHDTHTEPTWIVQSVFDNEQPWSDFAYTIGLADRGQSELHIYCHPSLGEDPAPDWRFSSRDMCTILNGVGQRLLAGTVRVGDSWSREYDNGLVTVTFRLDPPGDREDLEAFGVADGVDVLPLRWSLERARRGERLPLTSADEVAARHEFEALRVTTPATLGIPRAFRPPREPLFGIDQRYGPRTPVVQARAAAIWSSDAETLSAFLKSAACVDQGGNITSGAVLAAAEGRAVGLDDALESLRTDVIAAVHRGQPGAVAKTWASVFGAVAGPAHDEQSQFDRDRLERNLLHLFADALLSALAVEVLGRAARRETYLAGLGPWLCALEHEGAAPGSEWLASDAVIFTVREIVTDLDPIQRLAITQRHETAYQQDKDYSAVVNLLIGWATTGPACSPTMTLLSPWWTTTLSSAFTYRARLSAEDVRHLVRPFRQLLPQLEASLNLPL